MTPPQPRTPQQRKQDTLDRLDQDVDAWVATSGGDGPYLVPLSFLWDGETLLMATSAATPTGRNLQATGRVRVGIGQTRDVVLVEGTVEVLSAVPDETADAFAARTGFDPRLPAESYPWFRVRPQRIQAWREVDELAGRDVMRDGRWAVP
ncbi:pyridoxamine 5'-phosphate oxidase family protein [Pseudonocardia sp. MH-G8]|uniref:pyridoxamine 5'-phosphate oxidase family protein n=1 Tax=Pseudonocardia sp. MH-G8 TaxID=1854588 RepID=UPI000BA05DBF|nr:pyridoxamine 5'-phosphate oxidase family protein [Pseudonocardia sp. MH-G8]OZM79016.1 pyridoxamine 5'-phosphate oxidase [Pseudonocardia sp. MH-G8]